MLTKEPKTTTDSLCLQLNKKPTKIFINMLLRNSITNTKKFFRKSLQTFKSLFNIRCEDELYQKLPKLAAPYYNNPMNPHNYQDLEKFYTEFTHRWDSHNRKAKKRNKKHHSDEKIASTQFTQRREDIVDESKAMSSANVETKQEEYSYSKSVSVEKKLKEIEMMDVRNVDHVLDIEEVLYYYSRLTCPAYVDIVDKFFMDICTEFLGQPASNSPTSVNSRPRFRSVRH